MAKMSQTAAILHEAADLTNDAHDHDELHAAACVVDQIKRGECEYIDRWISGLFEMKVVTDVRDGVPVRCGDPTCTEEHG